MKKGILLVLAASVMATTAVAHVSGPTKISSSKICKVFEKKSLNYKSDMPKHDYAKVTLSFYENQVNKFCKK